MGKSNNLSLLVAGMGSYWPFISVLSDFVSLLHAEREKKVVISIATTIILFFNCYSVLETFPEIWTPSSPHCVMSKAVSNDNFPFLYESSEGEKLWEIVPVSVVTS